MSSVLASDLEVPAAHEDSTGVFSAIIREKSVRFGAIILGAIIVLAVLAPVVAAITGHGPTEQFQETALDEAGVPVGPNSEFWLGADGNGRDVLVRTIYGARVSLLVGIPATTIAMIIGTTVGLLAGFLGGRVDRMLSLFTDIVLSFPFVVTALSLVALNRDPDGGSRVNPVLLVIIIISLFAWTYYARLIRGLVADLRSRPFVEASETIGASMRRIIWRDIVPNIAPVAVVFWAVQLPQNIIAEATMSFLGIGVQAPSPSWGNIIADAQRSSLYQVQPFYLIAPAVFLILTVIAFNAISSGIRNVLDPQSR